MTIKGRPKMTVAEELTHQSYLIINASGSATWWESHDPRYVALMEWRVDQRDRAPAATDAVMQTVRANMKSKNRRKML
ncbi:MAG: hypothetical protein ACR2OE_15015 [Thermomicrobiales bacterium]